MSDGDLAWMGSLEGMGPYLVGIFVVLFVLHLLVYDGIATRMLLTEDYLKTGIELQGRILSSEPVNQGDDSCWVEVVYDVREHMYMDDASMRFRNPDLYEQKTMLRRFRFDTPVNRGEEVQLLRPKMNGTRSGLPVPVIHQILKQHSVRQTYILLGVGIPILLGLLGCVVYQVTLMEQPSLGWKTLAVCLAVAEGVSFLYAADQFLKSKRRRFDSAKPFVASSEQQHDEQEYTGPADPFKVPLHEFAGHSRVSQREH